MGYQGQYQQPPPQYPPYNPPQQYPNPQPQAQSPQALNVCQLCHNQGHYDYQCEFAGDFLNRTQKAFNRAHSYSHTDPNQGQWATGEDDNENPNDQPFQ